MRFARWTFAIAGIYGIMVLLPMYFSEGEYGLRYPPAVGHPEFYYGFAGVALAWQVMFLVVAREPRRLRPVMLVGIIEKLSYGIAVPLLYAQGRVPTVQMVGATIDLVLGGLFLAAWLKTREGVQD